MKSTPRQTNNFISILLPCLIFIIPQILQGELYSETMARKVLTSFYRCTNVSFDVEDQGKVVWLDPLNKGSKTDFYAIYNIGEGRPILDVFTIRSGQPENLYHEVYDGYELGAFHATLSNKTFFISTQRGGSGGYLSLSIFDYDGAGKLRLVCKIGSLFQGHIFVSDNRVYIRGDNQRYELKYNGKTCFLLKDQQRITCPPPGTHILAYHVIDGKFFLTYDGKKIEFQQIGKDNDDDYRRNKAPIEIGVNEHVVLDDNMEEPGQVRFLSTLDDLEKCDIRGGTRAYLADLKATAVGVMKMYIDYNYGTQYEIQFLIKKDDK